MAEASAIATLNLVGAHPALDFANTMGALPDGAPREYLTDYAALIAWGLRLGLLSRAEAADLRERAADAPEPAARAVCAARDLRGAIYGLFAAHAVGTSPPRGVLARFNRHLARAQTHAVLTATRSGFHRAWTGGDAPLERVLWPVAAEAAALLTSDQLARVRQCAGENCLWLFLDVSKNGSRRWCSMSDCGNRAKVRRFRDRPDGAD
jgi:predicted RNA-binding Zn ribbon-like protein